ncbi:MAG: hypothetical protein K0R92_3592 [Lachnospiraceae bacterium]|nr:hypothetical protein [Lachnospiraceae bacterium]
MISPKRCPWCGYEEKWYEFGFAFTGSGQIARCKSCKKTYRKKKSHWLFIINFLIFLISYFTFDGSLDNSIFMGTSIALLFFTFVKLPFIKENEGPWYKSVETNEKTAKVRIKWFSYKQRGLIFCNYRVWNGYILPICFVDLQNNPISHMWCIKIDKIKRKGKTANADMNYILSEAPDGLLVTGNQFLIFHKKHNIGRGEIIG